MTDPLRFLAIYPDKQETSNDPNKIMRDAEAWSAEHFQPVHLYQHVITVEAVREGD